MQERNAQRSNNGGKGSQVQVADQQEGRAHQHSDRTERSVTQVSDFDSDLERQKDANLPQNQRDSAADRIVQDL